MADAVSYKYIDFKVPNNKFVTPYPIVEVTRSDGSKYRFADLNCGFIQNDKSWYSPKSGAFPCCYYRGNKDGTCTFKDWYNNNVGPVIGTSGSYSTGVFYSSNGKNLYLVVGQHLTGGTAFSSMAIRHDNAYDIMCTGAYVGGGSASRSGNRARIGIQNIVGSSYQVLFSGKVHGSWHLRKYTDSGMLKLTDYEQYIGGCCSGAIDGSKNRESRVAILIGVKMPMGKLYFY